MKNILLFILCLFITSKFTGKVVKISDGDTIIVLNDNNEQIKIRLEGIDCPEKNQPWGQQAKKATSDFCFGKNVEVVESSKDKYGRTLAFIYVNNVCLNKYLIENGFAWHYKKFNNDPELAKLEEKAKLNKIGLWSDANPMAPWDWRKIKKTSNN